MTSIFYFDPNYANDKHNKVWHSTWYLLQLVGNIYLS